MRFSVSAVFLCVRPHINSVNRGMPVYKLLLFSTYIIYCLCSQSLSCNLLVLFLVYARLLSQSHYSAGFKLITTLHYERLSYLPYATEETKWYQILFLYRRVLLQKKFTKEPNDEYCLIVSCLSVFSILYNHFIFYAHF